METTANEDTPTGKSLPATNEQSYLEIEAVKSWTTVPVVLDLIFDDLPVRDLKNVRLTCRLWASVGARNLADKFVVRLDNAIAKPMRGIIFSHTRYPKFTNDNEPSHQSFKFNDTGFEFRPKRLAMFGCHNPWKLSQRVFSEIRELQIAKFTPSEGTFLLHHQLHYFFKKLKSLKLRELLLEREPQVESCGKNPCSCWRRCRIPRNIDLTSTPSKSLALENLVIEVSPIWNDFSWDLLLKSGNLKSLEVIQSLHPVHDVANRNTYFSSLLETLRKNIHFLPKLRKLSLRFDLTTDQCSEAALALLNTIKLTKIVLEVNIGGVGVDIEENWTLLKSFITGLSTSSFQALSIHFRMALVVKAEDKLLPCLEILDGRGYFKRSEWDVSVMASSTAVARFRKTENQFVAQVSSICNAHRCPFHISSLVKSFFLAKGHISKDHNYAFRHNQGNCTVTFRENHPTSGRNYINVRPRPRYCVNEVEVLDPAKMFEPEILDSKWISIEDSDAPCSHRCDRSNPKYLCDLPGFLQEAKIITGCPDNLKAWSVVGAWTFCKVPPEVLKKWLENKDSEIALQISRLAPCNCSRPWWWPTPAELL